MDLRDIIRKHPDIVVGHEAVSESLNARKEIERFARDPLRNIVSVIDDSDSEFLKGDIGRYIQAFGWYSFCLRRVLTHISVARRADAELKYHPRNKKYSSHQKRLSAKHNEISPYLELDYNNLIIHSCILLDRVISLSRRFLNGPNLPSFTSFNKHKQSLSKNAKSLSPNHCEYAQYVIENTDWFEIPLKVLRDKFLVHSSERHMSFFGWRKSNWDLHMITLIPAAKEQDRLLERVKVINFAPRRLARDMESFLHWFDKYWRQGGRSCRACFGAVLG
jgi:hypothetical protein